MIVMNRVYDEKQGKNATLPLDRIQSFLKRQITAVVPVVDERMILNAIVKAVPLIALERDSNKPPTRQILDLADALMRMLTPDHREEPEDDRQRKRSGLGLRLGR